MYAPIQRLIIFIILYFAGNLLAGISLVVLALSMGFSMPEIMTGFSDGSLLTRESMLRPILLIQAVCLFLLPALIFKRLYYPDRLQDYFQIRKAPQSIVLFAATIFLFASYPLVQLSYAFNQTLPLKPWMYQMESEAMRIMESILEMESTGMFLFNLLAIAVLPAVGEELVFRGIIQKQLIRLFKKPWIGIWIASIVFSVVHFQFEGFLPRVVLGLVLGYLYYWSRNLWIPILVHFLNNGFQVTVLYYTGLDLSDMQAAPEIQLTWWSILFSLALMFALSELIRRRTRKYA